MALCTSLRRNCSEGSSLVLLFFKIHFSLNASKKSKTEVGTPKLSVVVYNVKLNIKNFIKKSITIKCHLYD
jgi:hypothetical protein